MITTFYPPYNFGGDGIFVQRLSNELARRGHRVEVVHCADAYRLLAGREPIPEPGDNSNVVVHRLSSPFGFLSPLATQQTGRPVFKAARLREILARGFDVIHFHNISLVGGPQVLEYGNGVKLYTLHEYWLVCPTHTLFRFGRAPCTRPHCLACSLAYRRPPQWWRYTGLLKSAVKHVDAFISPNRFAGDAHHRRGLDIPIVYLPYFVPEMLSTPAEPAALAPPADPDKDGPGARRAEIGAEIRRPYFLYVGRLERIKGLHTLLPVFRRYRRARLLVAGAGADEGRLRRMAAGDDQIVFLGRLAHSQLEPLYRQATAVIVPSICYEVSPLVMFEAFQQETPVIARNRGGMPDVVAESGGGWTYDSDEDLIEAMDQALADPDRRDQMGRQAHRTFATRWSADAHLESYLQLIARLKEARQAAPHGSPGSLAREAPPAQ